MTWTPQAVDGARVIVTDGDAVAIADLFKRTLRPLAVDKYAPLAFGAWEAVTAEEADDIEQQLPSFTVLD